MNLFDENCRISAEYDKEGTGISMEVEGDVCDVLALLTAIVDQLARKLHISGAELVCRIGSVSGDIRSLIDEETTTIDFGVSLRAKDKRDGD